MIHKKSSSLFCLIYCSCVLSLAVPLHAMAPGSGRALFNVVDYGAKNDASAPATEAFQKAIQAAKSAGGGTVYVPPGNYTSGPIELFSNMTLEIDSGAVVAFPAIPLPFTKGRQQGIDALTPVPLIGGHDLENVTITGRGILTSNNADWMKLHGRIVPSHPGQEEITSNYADLLKSQNHPASSATEELGSANGPQWEHLLQALETGKPISDGEYRAAAAEMRPSFVRFMNSKNILVEDVRFVGSPMWTIHLLYSENATIRNVIIETHPGVHTDGIVVDSSRFVRIDDDYIDTGDDGIVIKSGKDADGRRVHRPSEDITITNCTVHHAHGAVTIGSETSGGVRNIVASNITAIDTENGIRIKSRRGRGGVIEDLRFDNWTMENVGEGIIVTSYYRMEGEAAPKDEPFSERTPIFRNIAISHVTISGAKTAIEIEGLPEMPITSLRLTDIMANSKAGLIARKTDGLELHNVQVNADRGSAFEIDASPNLELDGIATRTPVEASPVLRLTHSSGAILRNSRAFPGTGIFLSTGSGELKSIHLESNVLNNAATPAEER
ncbi:MAG: glycoside hydrolase family 28 protein [Terracidiphilus sp.]|jgi:polygalacturonase